MTMNANNPSATGGVEVGGFQRLVGCEPSSRLSVRLCLKEIKKRWKMIPYIFHWPLYILSPHT